MQYYQKEKSDVQTACVVCRTAIDYDEECAVGVQGTKVAGRILCITCLVDPVRQEKERRLHTAKVMKIKEKGPKHQRYREKLIKKNKKYVPSSLRGSSALRQDYLNALKRDY